MSNAVLPKFTGLAWNRIKAPAFVTREARAVSGFERRVGLRAYPLWSFSWRYDFLKGQPSPANHQQQMLDFFLLRGGKLESFLVNDPSDNTATDQAFGIGNGSRTQFQLVRSLVAGGFAEPVQNLNGAVVIKDNGSTVSGGAYTVSSTGLVTFTTAPVNTHVLTWSGAYYFRCRFLQDMHEYDEFMRQLFTLKKLEFVGATGNKV